MRKVKAEVGERGRWAPPSRLEVTADFEAPQLPRTRTNALPPLSSPCVSKQSRRATRRTRTCGSATWRRRKRRRRSEDELCDCSSPAPGTDCFYAGSLAASLPSLCPTRKHSPLRESVPATPINLPLSTCMLSYSQHARGPSQFPQLPRLECCSRHQCALPAALPPHPSLGSC